MKKEKNKFNMLMFAKAIIILMFSKGSKSATFNKIDNDYYLIIIYKSNYTKSFKL